MGPMTTSSTPAEAATTLRKITEATTGLPDDSVADAALRDRLELAASVLDVVAKGAVSG